MSLGWGLSRLWSRHWYVLAKGLPWSRRVPRKGTVAFILLAAIRPSKRDYHVSGMSLQKGVPRYVLAKGTTMVTARPSERDCRVFIAFDGTSLPEGLPAHFCHWQRYVPTSRDCRVYKHTSQGWAPMGQPEKGTATGKGHPGLPKKSVTTARQDLMGTLERPPLKQCCPGGSGTRHTGTRVHGTFGAIHRDVPTGSQRTHPHLLCAKGASFSSYYHTRP